MFVMVTLSDQLTCRFRVNSANKEVTKIKIKWAQSVSLCQYSNLETIVDIIVKTKKYEKKQIEIIRPVLPQ